MIPELQMAIANAIDAVSGNLPIIIYTIVFGCVLIAFVRHS